MLSTSKKKSPFSLRIKKVESQIIEEEEPYSEVTASNLFKNRDGSTQTDEEQTMEGSNQIQRSNKKKFNFEKKNGKKSEKLNLNFLNNFLKELQNEKIDLKTRELVLNSRIKLVKEEIERLGLQDRKKIGGLANLKKINLNLKSIQNCSIRRRRGKSWRESKKNKSLEFQRGKEKKKNKFRLSPYYGGYHSFRRGKCFKLKRKHRNGIGKIKRKKINKWDSFFEREISSFN